METSTKPAGRVRKRPHEYQPSGRVSRTLGFLLFLWVSALSILFGQAVIQHRPRPAINSSRLSANLRVDKNLVLEPVSVVDNENRPVVGLERSNFRVFDDKVEQKIESFSTEDEPVAVGLVFDISGSMDQKLRESRMAVKAFFATANPEDEFLLVEFSDTPTLAVPLTNDSHQIETRLAFSESRGKTALLDAIHLGLTEIKKSKKSRRALLVISDGGDNHSRYREREIQELIRESDVLIYAVGIYEPWDLLDRTPEELAGPSLLKEVAEQTGGREYSVGYVGRLADITKTIGIALRNLYVLGFSPTNTRRDGRYHAVQIKIVRTHGLPPMLASWRLGYIASD
jgi:Ca-activated chloride channel homolog